MHHLMRPAGPRGRRLGPDLQQAPYICSVRYSEAVDGFRLAYDDHPAEATAVVLLHGWPGDRHDFRRIAALLAGRCCVVVPDLRGFGESDTVAAADPVAYAADAQARSVLALVERLALAPAVLARYDIGSRVAQAMARARPDLVRALVLSPPLPGAGPRVLSSSAQREFWYQAFHQLPLAEQLLDGSRAAVRAYLEHFWTHWSGPGFQPDDAEWPEHDPLFPRAWSDRVGDYFADVDVRPLDGVGHFTPLEAPQEFARAILQRAIGGAQPG